MRIGIIGAGHIGCTLARHFVDAGHEVAAEGGRKHRPGSAAYTEGLHTGGLRIRLAAWAHESGRLFAG
jgi:8-hydroxy-5-deazaflavin:NADPH oxidoreductase